jgi:T5orf172 domain.
MVNLSDDELLAELGVTPEAKTTRHHTPQEERIIAGFEDIQRFVEKNGHLPLHGETRDIFERLYAVRLDRLRTLPGVRALLAEIDVRSLLNDVSTVEQSNIEALDDETLLAELGVRGTRSDDDVTVLRHVAPRDRRRAAEEIANRTPCKDFELFKPLFKQADQELKEGLRYTEPFGQNAKIEPGDFFILSGQIAYVAESGKSFKTPNGETDARLRVIYSNETESNLLLRSLQRALYKDEAGRRLSLFDPGPLFSDSWKDDDIKSGTIYVLRSLSGEPYIAKHRELIHKIGVTGGKVEARIADAIHDPTYLLADVEVVATYKLANINRTKLESLFHRIFEPAKIDLVIHDRFGRPIHPREWFLVPLQAIDEAVERIRDGSITDVVYDPKTARLIEAGRGLDR